MTYLALSQFSETAWWSTLAVGAVVLLVVLALLETLRRTVRDIEHGVDAVLGSGGRLAQNTWTIQLLGVTKERAGDLAHALGATTAADDGSKR